MDERGPSLPRVLVVDDDAPVARALRRELSSGFEVLLAEGPEAALEILAGIDRLEAVVCDLMMGGPSGLQVLSEAARRHPGCVRMLISGTPEAPEVERALATGVAQHFVPKPWAGGEIREMVRRSVDAGRDST